MKVNNCTSADKYLVTFEKLFKDPRIKNPDTSKVKFLQVLPNEEIVIKSPDNNVVLSSNVFIDIDIKEDNGIIFIHLVGKPPVKKVIYG